MTIEADITELLILAENWHAHLSHDIDIPFEACADEACAMVRRVAEHALRFSMSSAQGPDPMLSVRSAPVSQCRRLRVSSERA